jgi:hypothetical protein
MRIDTDNAKRPAMSIRGLRDMSSRISELFSGRHSAKAIAAIYTNILDKLLASLTFFFSHI